MRLVLIESPFAGDTDTHTAYGRAAMRDSLQRGEAPFASHLLYTLPGVLDDGDPLERTRGMEAGFAFHQVIDHVVAYCDFGISLGMHEGLKRAVALGKTIELRWLYIDLVEIDPDNLERIRQWVEHLKT